MPQKSVTYKKVDPLKVDIFDTSNTNQSHRLALVRAVKRINLKPLKLRHKLTIVVSTRNMVKVLPYAIFGGVRTAINIVGFGRLYSDYGILGRAAFNTIVWLHDKTTAQGFIVEHNTDKLLLEKFVRKPVYLTHGSGLSIEGFKRQRTPKKTTLRIGYLSRFHESKGSHEILKAAKSLPDDRELIIAGWDIKGNKYSAEFQNIAQSKSNVIFLGRLKAREEISQFFNNIDLFLSPSVREGGNIALQEAIWHRVPFLTTNVPGCDVLAQIFLCPAISMEEFGDAVLDKDLCDLKVDTSAWDEKIKPFLTHNVEKEYLACLSEIVQNMVDKTHF